VHFDAWVWWIIIHRVFRWVSWNNNESCALFSSCLRMLPFPNSTSMHFSLYMVHAIVTHGWNTCHKHAWYDYWPEPPEPVRSLYCGLCSFFSGYSASYMKRQTNISNLLLYIYHSRQGVQISLPLKLTSCRQGIYINSAAFVIHPTPTHKETSSRTSFCKTVRSRTIWRSKPNE
jgi:hypothetical protein